MQTNSTEYFVYRIELDFLFRSIFLRIVGVENIRGSFLPLDLKHKKFHSDHSLP